MESEDPPPPPADARAPPDQSEVRPFGELTGSTVVAFPTSSALEAEARVFAQGLPLAGDADFEPIAALVASGEARRGDVLAVIEEARAKGRKCPKTWANLAHWARGKARDRTAAAARAGPRSAARASPSAPTPEAAGEPPWREHFERVWGGFPRDPTASRPRAEAAFAELSADEQRDFAGSIGAIAEHIRRQKLSSPHNLATFIAERRFAGFAPAPTAAKPMFTVQRDSAAGRAWEAYRRANGGRGVPWEAGGGKWRFETEFPPEIEARASA